MTEIGPFIQALAPLGVGGAMAAFIFYVYHRDNSRRVESEREDRKVLLAVVERNMKASDHLAEEIRRQGEQSVEVASELRRLAEAIREAEGGRERQVASLIAGITAALGHRE